MDIEGAENGRFLIKKLNAERRAREKRKLDLMVQKEAEFKLEQDKKESELLMAEQLKLQEIERKREESKQRILERKQLRVRSLMAMKQRTKELQQLFGGDKPASDLGSKPHRLYQVMQMDFEEKVVKREKEEREMKLRELKLQRQSVHKQEMESHRMKYQSILQQKKEQLRNLRGEYDSIE